MEENKAIDALATRFIGKRARVITKNQRKFEGKIVCIDSKGSLVLHEAVAEIHPSQNCPLNYDLVNYADSKLQYEPPTDLPEEEKKKLIR
jgi:small nuclear ribonucleoprotein (snRNP)-like protein